MKHDYERIWKSQTHKKCKVNTESPEVTSSKITGDIFMFSRSNPSDAYFVHFVKTPINANHSEHFLTNL